jgi:DNA-directed RNA polymerase specialized sigma24 family protein
MNLLCTDRTTTDKSEAHATSDDFRTVFTEEMSSLYRLSLLLTSDQEMAEQCFLGGVNDSLRGTPVFKQWASSWAKRRIIENAIRIMAPRPDHASGTALAVHVETNGALQTVHDKDGVIASVLELADFERFAFVLSVLERYPDQDCSVLLGCTLQQVRDARTQALQQIAEPYTKSAVAGRTTDLLS